MKRNRLIAIVIALLILVAVISVAISTIGSEEEEKLVAQATATPQVIRAEEDIIFSGEGSKGDIVLYNWDFGDGTNATGIETSHTYEMTGWFNVTLTVEGKDGKVANATVLVGVQLEDGMNTRHVDRDRDLRPMWAHGPGILIPVGPNVAHPTTECTYDILRPVGTFTIYVDIWVYDADGRAHVTSVHTQAYTATGSDIQFTYTVEPEDLPDEVAMNRSMVHLFCMIDQGRWGGTDMSLETVFPLPLITIEEPHE
jgi:PKD repeat protein